MPLPYYRKKYFKNVWRRWRVLIIIFIALIIYVLIRLPSFQFSASDGHSWFISFIDDLLFFGIGLLTAILGSKLPQEESFDNRVSVLANGKYANKDAETYLSRNIKNLITYSMEHKLVITLKRISYDSSYIYIHVESLSHLANMTEDAEIKLKVEGSVCPGDEVDGTRGFVTYHACHREGLPAKFFIPEGHIKDLNNEPETKYTIDTLVPINANSTARLKVSYEIWIPSNGLENRPDDWYYHCFPIFTAKSTVSLVNELQIPVSYKYRYPVNSDDFSPDKSTHHEKTGTVNAGIDATILPGLSFIEDDKITILFSIN